MAMLSLPIFNIGFPFWLLSIPMVLNVQTTSQSSSPPLEQHQPHVDPKIDPFPSSTIASSSFLPLRLVKVLILVTRKVRRRRKG